MPNPATLGVSLIVIFFGFKLKKTQTSRFRLMQWFLEVRGFFLTYLDSPDHMKRYSLPSRWQGFVSIVSCMSKFKNVSRRFRFAFDVSMAGMAALVQMTWFQRLRNYSSRCSRPSGVLPLTRYLEGSYTRLFFFFYIPCNHLSESLVPESSQRHTCKRCVRRAEACLWYW